MWKGLYDSFLQLFSVSWGKFIQHNKSCGRLVRDDFQNKVYPDIGLYLVAITIIFSFIYYYFLNYRFGRYYTTKSWLITLTLNSIVIGLVTFLKTNAILDGPVCDASRQILWIAIINAIYAAFLFLVISLLIKWKSPMGKRTPL